MNPTHEQLVLILKVAALAHLGILVAGLLAPRIVGVADHLRPLPAMIRHMFQVYYAYTGLTILACGLICWIHANDLARGAPLGTAFLIYGLAFWGIRIFVGVFYFRVGEYMTRPWHRAGYQLLNFAFVALVAAYLIVLWKGGAA